MELLTHKSTLLFSAPGTWSEAHSRYEGGGASLTIKPKPGIQTAPEWIRNTATFKAAIKAGLLVEINRIVPEPGAAALPGVPMPEGYELAGASAPAASDPADATNDATNDATAATDIPDAPQARMRPAPKAR